MPGNLKRKISLVCCGVLFLPGLLVCLQAHTIFYGTSSAAQVSNTVERVGANGSGNTLLLTATGSPSLSRCTAVALDAWNGKVFLADGGGSSLWSVNLDGTGLALVKNGLVNFPGSLALDVLKEQIYYTTSSA